MKFKLHSPQNKAIEFNNASHENYYYIGSVYNKLGKTDLAISNLEKAISIKKDFLKGIIELGKLYQICKDYKKAFKYYQLAESMNFDNRNIRLFIAECYNGMKRYDDAIDVIKRLIRQNTNDKDLIKLLTRIRKNKFSLEE